MLTDIHVTDSLLRCVNDFASLMLDERQKKRPSFTLRREQTANKQPREDIYLLQIRRCINATAETGENVHYFPNALQSILLTLLQLVVAQCTALCASLTVFPSLLYDD